MAGQFEVIGNYNVRELANGMYSVSLNNGNMGAYMCDEAGVNRLREKYQPNMDTCDFSPADKSAERPKMTYEEAKKIYLFGSGEWGFDNIKLHDEAEQVMIDHEVSTIKNWFKSLFNWS